MEEFGNIFRDVVNGYNQGRKNNNPILGLIAIILIIIWLIWG